MEEQIKLLVIERTHALVYSLIAAMTDKGSDIVSNSHLCFKSCLESVGMLRIMSGVFFPVSGSECGLHLCAGDDGW